MDFKPKEYRHLQRLATARILLVLYRPSGGIVLSTSVALTLVPYL